MIAVRKTLVALALGVSLFASAPASAIINWNGTWTNGINANGLQMNAMNLNALNLNGLQMNGLQMNAMNLNGVFTNGAATGEDGATEVRTLRVIGIELPR